MYMRRPQFHPSQIFSLELCLIMDDVRHLAKNLYQDERYTRNWVTVCFNVSTDNRWCKKTKHRSLKCGTRRTGMREAQRRRAAVLLRNN